MDHGSRQVMTNPFVQLIADGRIRTLADLKAAYHNLVMQTHPDAVGSDRLLSKFLEFSDQYEEAKGYLAQSARERDPSTEAVLPNPRLEFYRQLHLIESMEMPYAFHYRGEPRIHRSGQASGNRAHVEMETRCRRSLYQSGRGPRCHQDGKSQTDHTLSTLWR